MWDVIFRLYFVIYREQILIKADNSDPILQMLIKLIDLLASCCEGENLFIESICQNVIGISELLKVVPNINLCDVNIKFLYIRFYLCMILIQFAKSLLYAFCFGCTWIHKVIKYKLVLQYCFMMGTSIVICGWVLAVWINRLVWGYLEHVSLLLEGVVKALINLPSSQVKSAKENLTSRATIIRRDNQGFRQRAKTMSNQKDIPFVTNTEGELIPGLLIYLMEGILPMLKV